MCYPISKYVYLMYRVSGVLISTVLLRNIRAFLDRPDVRETIGVDDHIKSRNFSSCNWEIGLRFNEGIDRWFPAQYQISALLERGIRTLIYVGANDWGCNWVRITDSLANVTHAFYFRLAMNK